MRRFLVLLATVAACVGLSTLPAAATPSYCGLVWGSQDESNPKYSPATLTNVGQSTIGLGVRARLPFRVGTLDNPTRVVIDVAHHW